MSPPPMQLQAPAANSNLFNMLSSAPAPAATQYMSPAAAPMQTPMNMMKPMVASPPPMMNTPMGAPLMPNRGVMSPMSPPARTTTASPGAQPKASANFDDLWSMSLGAGTSKPAAGGVGMGAQKSMKDLEKEKAQASIWGGAGQKPASGFGAFGGAPASSAAPPSSSGNGLDDLLF